MKGPNFKRARERPANEPIGVILAGGRGRRMGGSKATVELCGKPLISYPLKAMEAALSEVVVLAKADTELPNLPGATVWIEPDPRRHPLVGVMQALALAGGRTVLICAGDLPFVAPELLRRLAGEDPRGSPAVLAAEHGQMQPLLGCYQPRAAELLAAASEAADRPVREAVEAIAPLLFEVEDPDELFNVDAPDDLLMATAMIDRRRGAGRPSTTA